MSGAAEISVIREPAGIAALESDWWDLWRRSREATPFQSPAWLLPWWEIFRPGDLRVTALWRDGRLIALAPFYLERRDRDCRLLPLGIGISDYLDILLDDKAAETAAALLVRHIETMPVRWSEWELPELSPAAAAQQLPCPAGCREEAGASSCCPILPLSGCGSLEAVLPKRKLRKLRMARRRAARRGDLSVIAADPLNIDALVQELVRLNRQRHAGQSEPCVFDDPRVEAFQLQAAPRLLQAGMLRLNALMIGPEIAAVHYGLHGQDRAYAYLSGFDSSFEYESPGSLLIGHAIAAAIAESAREFDFLRGAESYKAEWGALPRMNQRRVFRRMPADAHGVPADAKP